MNDIEEAKTIYEKLKFYCEFHGLDLLTSPESECINDLFLLLSN